MSSRKMVRVKTVKLTGGVGRDVRAKTVPDRLAVEEPLEIRIHGTPVAVTMRTPGDDVALTAGFLHGEGLLRSREEIAELRDTPSRAYPHRRNVVHVTFAGGVAPDLDRLRRNFFATSSCGVCGKTSIEQVKSRAKPLRSGFRVPFDVLRGLDQRLRRAQPVFTRTGGLHAAGIFDASGAMLCVHEDVGRHNAVDKGVGEILLRGELPLDRHILMVSGRASFEILQKAAMARIPVVAAVSAPSSLAVSTARALGITLIGFLRGDAMNVYTHTRRILR